ncbi:CDP-alcohol phosphatidyltransferase family protein [Candidatus Dependentiae bacterium]|nr:CDP-alcohol phosphatidyltransferase family protein [Candidatus Dependentiae bacterium]
MLTIASCITMVRIVFTPVVVWYIRQGQWDIALILFVIAALTDLVDGFVARRFQQQSDLGQLLDPVADKCLIMATLYALLMSVAAGLWHEILVLCLLFKEVILLSGGAFLKLRYNFFIQPSRLSRAASLAEIFLILFLFISLILFGEVGFRFFSVLLIGNLLLSVWLLVRYAKIVCNL